MSKLKFLRYSFFTLLLLAVLTVVTFEIPFVRTFTQNLIGKAVIEIVRTNTASNVEVYYGEVEFSIINSRFTISDIAIINPGAIDSLQTNQFREAKVVNLTLDIRGLWRIYFTRKLDIEGLYIYDPDLKLTIDPGSERPSLTFETGNLYSHISRMLDELDIRKFELHHGAIEFRFPTRQGHRNITLNDISLMVNNFELSSTTQQDTTRIFYTDDIDLKIYNQNIEFADNLHNGYFDSLHVSTNTNTFLIYGLTVTPRKGNPISSQSNLYNFSTPQLDIEGIDFLKAYHQRTLEVEKITLKEPDINIDNRRSGQAIKESDLIIEMNRLFNPIKIRSISINNGKLAMNTYPVGEARKLTLDNIDLDIENVDINESNRKTGLLTDYFNDFTLSVDNYEFTLPGRRQLLSIDTLTLSTRNRALDISSVKLIPVRSGKDSNDPDSLEDLHLKKIKMTGFDPEILFRDRIIVATDLTVHEFSWIHTLGKDTVTEQTQNKPFVRNELYPLVEDYLSKIHIGNIHLYNLNIGLRQPKASSGFLNFFYSDLKVENFELDSSRNARDGRVLYSDRIILSIPELNIISEEQAFLIEDILIDTQAGLINTGGIEIDTLNGSKNWGATGTMNALRINGADFEGILYENNYSLDFIQFIRPEISLYNRAFNKPNQKNTEIRSQPAFINSLDLKKLSFKNGIFHFFDNGSHTGTINNVFFEVEKFNLDPGNESLDLKNSNFEDLSVKSNELKWSLSEIGHDLVIDSVSFSRSDSSGVIMTLQIFPLVEGDNTYDVTIPQIDLVGLDIHGSLYKNKLNLSRLKMVNPTFNLSQGDKKVKPKNKFDFEEAGSYTFLWDTVNIDRIIIDQGDLEFSSGDQSLSVARFDLEANKHYTRKGKHMADDFLFTEEIAVLLSDFEWSDGVTNSNFKISKLNVNTGNQSLRADSLAILSGRDSANRINIPMMTMDKIKFRDLLFDRELLMDEVHITKPGVRLLRAVNIKAENSQEDYRFAQLQEYPLDTGKIRHLRIRELHINKAEMEVRNEEDSLSLDNLDLHLTDFHLHPDSLPLQNKAFHADQYLISVTDLSRNLNDHYTLEAGNISFHSGLSRLSGNSIQLIPAYGKYAFSGHIKEQTDWIKLSAEKLLSEEFDFEGLVRNRDLNSGHTLIEGLSMELFRDKNVPIPENQVSHLPQHYLKKAGSEINIDTILIKNSDITYEELPADMNIPGKITFNDLSAQAFNITNQSERIASNPSMTVTSQGLLMNEGRIMAKFDFDLKDPQNSYRYNTSLGSMDLTRLNPILEPVAFVSVKQGFASRMQQTVRANDNFATGTMAFYYNDLKVELLNREKPDHKGLGKSISTFFANTFVVRKRNPRPFLRRGEIFFERDTTRSIFNYLSKTTLSGIITSIGAGSNRKEIRKHNRELRKAAKLRRRSTAE